MKLIADRYQPTGSGSSGGMSEAIECEDVRLQRRVMLKRLKSNQEDRRLLDEQKALLRVRSKHVVQLLDIAEIECSGHKSPCLILEYIEGIDLTERCYALEEDYFKTLWQVAAGLSEIHEQGVIHRDLKPGNLRRDQEGVVKIFDFGLAREEGVDVKTCGQIGTRPYMAPELFGDSTISFSSKIDVYAFGVAALTLLDRREPAWSWKKRPDPAPTDAVKVHASELPPEIAEILQHCLAHEPAERPDMKDVADVLKRRLLHGKHRARLVLGGEANEMHSRNRRAYPKVMAGNKVISGIQIKYDGADFLIRGVEGQVRVNNRLAKIGNALPPACVIEFPASNQPYYATFDVSNPEVVL